jgi:hypothetical protein
MIREDYILNWIKRYVQWLAEIVGLVKAEDHQGAMRRIDLVLRTLLEVGPDSVTALTDGEILARLTLSDPPQLVQEKCAILAAVLQQLGQVCLAQQRPDAARDCFLKALQLALGLRLRGTPSALADAVPDVEDLAERLRPFSVPPRTWATLMLFRERAGRFAKAEDALFALLESAANGDEAVAVGVAFYERVRLLSDELLAAGNLPRAEVEAGLAGLLARRTRP